MPREYETHYRIREPFIMPIRLLMLSTALVTITAALSTAHAAPSPPTSASSPIEINHDLLQHLTSTQTSTPTGAPLTTAQLNLPVSVNLTRDETSQPSPHHTTPAPKNAPTILAQAPPPSNGVKFVPLAKPIPSKKQSKKEALSQAKAQDIKTIKGSPPPFNMWDAVWSGRINAGGSFHNGTSDTTAYSGDASAKAEWHNKDRLELGASLDYSENDEETTIDERRLTGTFKDFLNDKMFLDYNTFFETDDVDGVELRSNTGISFGHQVFDHERLKLSYSIGPSYLIEEIEDEQDTQKSAAYNWKMDFERKLKNEALTFYHNNRLIVPASQKEEYILNTNTGVRIPLMEKLVGSFDVKHDIDKGAANDASDTQTRYSVKLGYEW